MPCIPTLKKLYTNNTSQWTAMLSVFFHQVYFSDDVSGIYVVNPSPDDDTSNGTRSNGIGWNSYFNYDDENYDDDDERTVDAVKPAEPPETDVVGVADAFAKFRRLDRLIDEEEDVPRERKPVRKITPPRQEPLLLLHQNASSSLSSTTLPTPTVATPVVDAIPVVQRHDDVEQTVAVNGGDSKPTRVNIRHDETPVVATPDHRKTRDATDNEQAIEPEVTRSLPSRWESSSAQGSSGTRGSHEPIVPSEPVMTTKAIPDVRTSSGSQKTGVAVVTADISDVERPASSANVTSSVGVGTSANSGEKMAQRTRSNRLAFTRNKLAKFRLLESMHLERPQETVSNKVNIYDCNC